MGAGDHASPPDVALRRAVALKILALMATIVAVESSYAKLRLFRISEFLGAAFVVSVTAMVTEMLHL